jgi:hypothetical protein
MPFKRVRKSLRRGEHMKKIALTSLVALFAVSTAQAAPLGAGSTQNVTSQNYVHTAIDRQAGDVNFGSSTNTALAAATDLSTAIRALDADVAGLPTDIQSGTPNTITVTELNGVYTISSVNGAIATGNTGIVNGGDIYNYVTNAITSANVSVESGNTNTITVSESNGVYTVTAVNGAVVTGNTGLVTGGQVADAITNAVSAIDVVTGDANTIVVTPDGNGEFAVAAVTGSVASGNAGVATGGMVYTEQQARITSDGTLNFAGTSAAAATNLTDAIIALDGAVQATTYTVGDNLLDMTDNDITVAVPSKPAECSTAGQHCILSSTDGTNWAWQIVVE